MADKKRADMRHENGFIKEKVSGNENRVTMIPISSLRKFHNYMFKIRDDEYMDKLVESIRKIGVITPIIVRECEDGEYEIISGHRRWHAAKLVGLTEIPAFIKNMTDEDAVIFMVDSNLSMRYYSL